VCAVAPPMTGLAARTSDLGCRRGDRSRARVRRRVGCKAWGAAKDRSPARRRLGFAGQPASGPERRAKDGEQIPLSDFRLARPVSCPGSVWLADRRSVCMPSRQLAEVCAVAPPMTGLAARTSRGGPRGRRWRAAPARCWGSGVRRRSAEVCAAGPAITGVAARTSELVLEWRAGGCGSWGPAMTGVGACGVVGFRRGPPMGRWGVRTAGGTRSLTSFSCFSGTRRARGLRRVTRRSGTFVPGDSGE
jgi:hypothetical protein